MAAPAGDRAESTPGDRTPGASAVREAWRQAGGAADPRGAALAAALRALAREAHATGTPVTALLRALDRLAAADGAAFPRAWAGTQVIRAYYDDGTASSDERGPPH